MKADFHVHSNFSIDSDATTEMQVEEAIKKGLRTICMTEHYDLDYSEAGFEADLEQYIPHMERIKEKYRDKIEVLMGIEFGMQTHLGEACRETARKYSFDYILGSVHLVDGADPYYKSFFEGKKDQDVYRRNFEITLECLKKIRDIDALGHIDAVVRYGIGQEKTYSCMDYSDYIDAILKHLIQNEIALELNTGGWKYGLSFAHPHQDILKRYKELGGEMITIGSDGHKPEHVAYDFYRVKDYLEACGFKYYTEFRQRKPKFCAL